METEKVEINPNPRIKSLYIGVRNLRKIKIYPLSIGQEIETAEIIGTLINIASQEQEENDLNNLQVMEVMGKIIKDKVSEIIAFVTDPEDNVSLHEFDNFQFLEFIEIILDVNFGEHTKKFKEIREKLMNLFPSPNSLPKS